MELNIKHLGFFMLLIVVADVGLRLNGVWWTGIPSMVALGAIASLFAFTGEGSIKGKIL